MSRRRKLPAGIRGRGAVFTYTRRDHTGRQYSRKAGDSLAEDAVGRVGLEPTTGGL
jgi:hypothetical protein